jgi:hypothetical protein
MVNEVGGALDHAAPTAARADAATLARQGNQAFLAAVPTPEAHKAVGEVPAGEVTAELVLDESWHGASVAPALHLGPVPRSHASPLAACGLAPRSHASPLVVCGLADRHPSRRTRHPCRQTRHPS